jgi:hypothetical protein
MKSRFAELGFEHVDEVVNACHVFLLLFLARNSRKPTGLCCGLMSVLSVGGLAAMALVEGLPTVLFSAW